MKAGHEAVVRTRRTVQRQIKPMAAESDGAPPEPWRNAGGRIPYGYGEGAPEKFDLPAAVDANLFLRDTEAMRLLGRRVPSMIVAKRPK
jgi:hypothetical protein